ncbi:MAG: hypothetical protein DCF17_19580 [Shackletoniella antarctica]|uniref:TIR domain-containing protein n=1 Tax=Shackletoniella antarctica TaxID=268115 RepID=A0A2W4VRA0_9CYAN|nr:MAG: hypothetical protein DCF17_19580 [Shackletoniella antarctica]
MNAAPTSLYRSPFVSTFLSHSSADSALVEAVAEQLGRRGVLAWLDKNELLEMGTLDTVLKQAVQQQATLTLFLSEASLKSEWCKDEIRWAIEAETGIDHLLPVYLGTPLTLVKGHPLLRSRFLHPDGDKVNKLGYTCRQDANEPDPDAIADKIAATVYRRSIPEPWSEVVIVLDQRGEGPRRSFPTLPSNMASLNAPVLTFRPSLGHRQRQEVLTGPDWHNMVTTMTRSLSLALGTVRGENRKVRVLGNAQAGLVWAVGRHFNRTTSADLYSYGRDDVAITNKNQDRHSPVSGGDPNKAKLIPAEAKGLATNQPTVALGVGLQERYATAVQQAVPDLPLFWLECGFIEDSEQAMQLVADMVASVERLRREYGTRELVLFWITANHVALLAAANLTTHVIPKIKFMEWDHAEGQYVHLTMPGD